MRRTYRISTEGLFFRLVIGILIAFGWGVILQDLIRTKKVSEKSPIKHTFQSQEGSPVVQVVESTRVQASDSPSARVIATQSVDSKVSITDLVAQANAEVSQELFSWVQDASAPKLVAQAHSFLLRGGRTRVSEKVSEIYGSLVSQLRSQGKKLSYTLEYGASVAQSDVEVIQKYFASFYGVKLHEVVKDKDEEFSLVVEVVP